MRHTATEEEFVGWAICDYGSRQLGNVLEILTKELLPDNMKEGDIKVTLPRRWTPEEISKWAAKQYWFQSFPFAPIQKADSELVWKTIDRIDWSGQRVFDIGCHYGYMSFKASEKGAAVLGIDTDRKTLRMARTIRNHIIQQDVHFQTRIPSGNNICDVLLYLSVHHQKSPTYCDLAYTINHLKTLTRKHLFVELIIPPMFHKNSRMTEKEIDGAVGGEVIKKYKHKVRGVRKIYHVRIEK
jgi:SAM-dependent methyltransferase